MDRVGQRVRSHRRDARRRGLFERARPLSRPRSLPPCHGGCPCRKQDYCALVALERLIGKNWVITAHETPISCAGSIRRDRASGLGHTGNMDGPTFLAALLEWGRRAYSDSFERIEHNGGALRRRRDAGRRPTAAARYISSDWSRCGSKSASFAVPLSLIGPRSSR